MAIQHKSPEEIERFFCNFCTKSYSRNVELRKHTREFHLTLNPVQCKWCDQQFENEKIMRHHKRNCQEKEKHFKCRTCDVRFERRHRLYYHSCQKVTKFIECKCCDQKFENEAMIRRHKRSQKKENNYKCLKCDLMFDRRHKRQNHSCPNVDKPEKTKPSISESLKEESFFGLSNISISSPEKMKLGTLDTIDPLKEEKASDFGSEICNFDHNENTESDAEIMFRPKKKRGRPKGSKNVKKKANNSGKVKEIIGNKNKEESSFGLINVSLSSPEKMQLGTLDIIDPLKEEKASEIVMNDNREDLYDKITGGRNSIFKCHKCNMILKNNSRLMKHTKQCIATVTQSDVEDITVNLQFNNFESFESEICNFDPPPAQRRQNNTILQDILVRELKYL